MLKPTTRRIPANCQDMSLNKRANMLTESPKYLSFSNKNYRGMIVYNKISREEGIRTLDTLLAYTHFPGVRLRPLGHLSSFFFKRDQINKKLFSCERKFLLIFS